MSRGPFDRGWRRIICVASGPSLAYGDQKDLIRAECGAGRWRVLVANKTWQDFPNADVMFGADRKFWNAYDKRGGYFRGEKWTSDPACAAAFGLTCIRMTDATSKPGLSREPGKISNGGNTGHSLVMSAHALGGYVIVLAGFDMQLTGGTVNRDGILVGGPIHHHGPHEDGLHNPDPAALASWAERFAISARELADAGVLVLNATRETALTCFERVDLRTTLEQFKDGTNGNYREHLSAAL